MRRRDGLLTFFGLTFVITWITVGLFLVVPSVMESIAGPMTQRNPFFFLAVYAPMLTALLLTARLEGRAGLRDLLGRAGKWRVRWVWYLVPLVLIPIIDIGSDQVRVLVTHTPTQVPWSYWPHAFLAAPLALFTDAGPLGEELGWRGFALPRLLRRFSPLAASLILGVIWSLWHLPAFFLSQLSQAKLSLPIFIVAGMSLSVLMTWVYQHTGSVLVAGILMHLFSNLQAGDFSWYAAVAAVVAIGVVVATRARLGADAPDPVRRSALTPIEEVSI
ncbi:MAG: CPBP family intramembrane glutamic endopeptidase [Gemmatimonadota bacterium]